MAVALQQHSSGSALAVAAAAAWWQCSISGGRSMAGRAVAGGGSSLAAEAAVGDGRDEGGEVVMWRLFMFVIFLHISSVPVSCAEGSHIISVFV